jgi:hypothetical protein
LATRRIPDPERTVTGDDREDVVRKIGVAALWLGLGLAAVDLVARAIERILLTAPSFLIADRAAPQPLSARTDLPGSTPRAP